MSTVVAIGTWLVVGVVLVTIVLQTVLYLAAGREMQQLGSRTRNQLWRRVLSSPLAPRISILVPAYNEEAWIASSVASVLALTYPDLEVVVVNDGSSDDTMERLIERFDLSPVLPIYQRRLPSAHVRTIHRSLIESQLIVVDKDNGGKADALNMALNMATGDLVCVIDADTIVRPDALQQLVSPFLYNPDTVAVGGTVRLVNGIGADETPKQSLPAPRSLLAGVQAVEYVRAFLVGRLGWNALGGNLIISGAFGLFVRESVIDVGGYNTDTVGEDMELVVRLRRHAYEVGGPNHVEFLPSPVAWTEVPESWRTLARQRNRWFRGLLDVLVRHRVMMGRPRYRSAGLIALPYFLIVESLAPLIELVGLLLVATGLVTGFVSPDVLAPIAVAYLLSMAISTLILMLDDVTFAHYPGLASRLRMISFVIAEQLVFRPATLVWRAWGLSLFLQGRKEWGVQERKGLA
ncbi:MAG: glycosyltransferase family 2 protein [Acidimicrobiales bacterium]